MIATLRDQILKFLIGTGCGAEDPHSFFWDQLNVIQHITTVADVERVGIELKNKRREKFPLTAANFEGNTDRYIDIIQKYLATA